MHKQTKSLVVAGLLGVAAAMTILACGLPKPMPDDVVRIGRACQEVDVTADLIADALERIVALKGVPGEVKVLMIDAADAARRAEQECFKDYPGDV